MYLIILKYLQSFPLNAAKQQIKLHIKDYHTITIKLCTRNLSYVYMHRMPLWLRLFSAPD